MREEEMLMLKKDKWDIVDDDDEIFIMNGHPRLKTKAEGFQLSTNNPFNRSSTAKHMQE